MLVKHLSGGVLVASMLAIGCGGGTTPPSKTLTSVSVAGSSTVPVGSTITLTATAGFSDASTQAVAASSSWNSSNNAIATVSSAGVVTGVSAGAASITAAFQGMTSPPFAVTVASSTTAAFTVTPTNAADGNPGQCPIVPQSPSGFNLLNCKFDASSSTSAASIVSYQWEIPEGGTKFSGVTVDKAQIKCGDLPGVSTTSQKNVKLTITTNTGGSNSVATAVLFVKANPC